MLRMLLSSGYECPVANHTVLYFQDEKNRIVAFMANENTDFSADRRFALNTAPASRPQFAGASGTLECPR
jgi:hypothetical protein